MMTPQVAIAEVTQAALDGHVPTLGAVVAVHASHNLLVELLDQCQKALRIREGGCHPIGCTCLAHQIDLQLSYARS